MYLTVVHLVAAGLVAPIALTADLHQPARAWHFYAQTRFGSVMWYGAYLLPLFSLLSMLFGCELVAPHGGLFVLFIPNAISHVMMYILAIAAGSLVTGVAYAMLKRGEEQAKLATA